jgi:hypothetical protein
MDILIFLFPLLWGVSVVKDYNILAKARFVFMYYKSESYGAFVGVLSESNNTEDSNVLTKMLFYIICGAVCFVVLLFFVDVWMVGNQADIAGIFGDFFGGVLNPILTFLTFFGLIVTIVVQRHDLRLSRVEYERTAEALTIQSVENTFFNTLDLHNKIAEGIKFDLSGIGGNAYSEKSLNVRAFLRGYYKNPGDFEDSYRTPPGVYPFKAETSAAPVLVAVVEGRAAFNEILKYLSSGSATPKQVLERYMIIQNDHNHIVGHYFRNLYQVLKMIDGYADSVVSSDNKKKYASILRAQLSTKELVLLFINCLDNVCDKGNFKNLLIKYKMFEHLPCKEIKGNKGRFWMGGSTGVTVDRAMLLQYQKEKIFPPLDLEKVYGGAFGQNRSIPYNLARKSYMSDE